MQTVATSFLQTLQQAVKQLSTSISFTRVRDRSNPIRNLVLFRHPGMILLPYQASIISVVENYRLNIPLFGPSPKLLMQWISQYGLLWESKYGPPEHDLRL